MSAPDANKAAAPLNLQKTIPELMSHWTTLFNAGHKQGSVPSRIKELARLKVAELNECDT